MVSNHNFHQWTKYNSLMFQLCRSHLQVSTLWALQCLDVALWAHNATSTSQMIIPENFKRDMARIFRSLSRSCRMDMKEFAPLNCLSQPNRLSMASDWIFSMSTWSKPTSLMRNRTKSTIARHVWVVAKNVAFVSPGPWNIKISYKINFINLC